MHSDVVVLIPCLNEEEGISHVLHQFRKQGITTVYVGDGHSTDATAVCARRAGATVITVSRGKGNGFRELLSKIRISSKKRYVLIDGDGTYVPQEVGLFLAKKSDVVMGRRPLLGNNYRNGFELVKSIIHALGNLLISASGSILYLRPTRDICTGYWLFRGDALVALRTHLTAKGFELEADLFSTARKLNLTIATVPIHYEKRMGESKLIVKDAFIILKKLITNRLRR